MKASRFNVEVDRGDAVLLYNCLYGSLTECTPQELPLLRAILNDRDLTPSALPLRDLLIAQRHLISDATDELAIVRERKRAGISDPNRLDVVIMPTLDCNFACTYCYEERVSSRMPPATEDALVRWLEREVPRFALTVVHWFGGEPLLAYETVRHVSRRVGQTAARAGTECVLHMTTNGYLLTGSRMTELVQVGVRGFQITVDGPAVCHDRLRMLRDGGPTFRRVFRNVVALARASHEVNISLRINFNHTNLTAVPALLHEFPPDVRGRLTPVLEPIFGGCEVSATGNMPPLEISSRMTEYLRLAEALGYAVSPRVAGFVPGKLVYCYAERANQYVINYNGDVFKCSVSDFRPASRVGYLTTAGEMARDSSAWKQWTDEDSLFDDACLDCAYLPLCMGGCRKARIASAGSGSYCTLIPTNASEVLKHVSLGGFGELLRSATSDNSHQLPSNRNS